MYKKIFLILVILLPLFCLSQGKVTIVVMASKTEPFLFPLPINQRVESLDTNISFRLTHAVTAIQNLQTVYDNGWLEVIGRGALLAGSGTITLVHTTSPIMGGDITSDGTIYYNTDSLVALARRKDTANLFLSRLRSLHDFQVKLISGTNIKTINGVSLLGSGNLSAISDTVTPETGLVNKTRMSHITSYPILNQNTTGSAGSLAIQFIDWNAVSGGASIKNKPTIPAVQVNSDWNAVSGLAQILNKPTIPDTTKIPWMFSLEGKIVQRVVGDIIISGNTKFIGSLELKSKILGNSDTLVIMDHDTLKYKIMHGSPDSLYRYLAYSSGNNNVEVLATSADISATKSGGNITFNLPSCVVSCRKRLLSAKIRVENLSAVTCYLGSLVDMANTSMSDRWMPIVQAWREDTGQQLMGMTVLMSTTDFTKFTINGLIGTTICQIRLSF